MDVPRTALGDLIQWVEDETGWTQTDIARRARERGHELSKQTVSDYQRSTPKTLVPKTLLALAVGLNVPLFEVIQAVLSDHGILPYRPDDWSLEDAVRADVGLSEDSKRMLLAMIAEARRPGAASADELGRRRRRRPPQPPSQGRRAAYDPDEDPTT